MRGIGRTRVPKISVIAMGRWGGREMSYASDADAMFVMDDERPDDSDPTKTAGAVITQMRKLLTRPGADPPLSIDADLRPEGKGGALIRSLTAYRNYYSRWSSTWELQAMIRADALAGDQQLGAELLAEIDTRRWPENGLSAAQLSEIRKLKARVEAGATTPGSRSGEAHQAGSGWAGRCGVDRPAVAASARARGTRTAHLEDDRRPAGCPRRRRDRSERRRASGGGLGAGQPDPEPDHAGSRPRVRLAAGRHPRAGGAGRADGLRAVGGVPSAGRLPPGHPSSARSWWTGSSGASSHPRRSARSGRGSRTSCRAALHPKVGRGRRAWPLVSPAGSPAVSAGCVPRLVIARSTELRRP